MKKFVSISKYLANRAARAAKHLREFGKPVFRFFFIAYPIVIVTIGLIVLSRTSRAGEIRKLTLSPEKPAVINLAYGNATAVSFQAKPEKLVPGSPQKVEINFLGKDITVSPLGPSPGNLIVYTSGTRYVLLFKIVPESKHDDVVEVISSRTLSARPIRLSEDSYSIRKLSVVLKPRNWLQTAETVSFDVVAYQNRLVSDDFVDFLAIQKGLKCNRCVLKKRSEEHALLCTPPLVLPIMCGSDLFKEITIQGASS